MPSLRKRVSSYFRQLSFINEPKERRSNFDENSMVNKYLQGIVCLKDGPQILYGKNPTDLPNYDLGNYSKGSESIVGCYSGPNGGLTTVKRTEKHLSVSDDDIDFIDTQEDQSGFVVNKEPQKSPILTNGQPVDNTFMVIKVAGQEYCVMNKLRRKKSRSLGSLSDFRIEIEKTKICSELSRSFNVSNVNNCSGNVNSTLKNNLSSENDVKSNGVENKFLSDKNCNDNKYVTDKNGNNSERNNNKMNEKMNNKPCDKKQGHNLSKSKSEGNPFRHKKQGKIIKITHRPTVGQDENISNSSTGSNQISVSDSQLPSEWNRKSEYVFGLSDSLYDRNQVTKNKNGDPIADCFGIIAREDSAVLAVADGVNWGEKASIAAKSAVHGCLHYLNKTIFDDVQPFLKLTVKDDDFNSESDKAKPSEVNHISNTQEVFVCLLRAFNCAHDLILENKGMLTTLTVAVVLPLKPKNVRKTGNDVESYVCCVCNVGDTLAYVYSQRYGVRELTKGSHDITSNRDMRDALGALGPVDGINPELSNLTLSLTTLQKGDLIFVASDGLSDNFDPIVCRFAVHSKAPEVAKVKKGTPHEQKKTADVKREEKKDSEAKTGVKSVQRTTQNRKKEEGTVVKNQAPQKPPRKSKERIANRQSISSERSLTSSTSESQSNHENSMISRMVEQKVGRTECKDEKLQAHENNIIVRMVEQKVGRTECKDEKLQAQSGKIAGECTKNDLSEVVDPPKQPQNDFENPLVAQFMRENSLEDKTSERVNQPPKNKNTLIPLQKCNTAKEIPTSRSKNTSLRPPSTLKAPTTPDPTPRYRFLRSKTSIDMRPVVRPVLRNEEGLPYVSPLQRYELTLLLMEDVLRKGVSGRETECVTARKLCESLVDFTKSITAGKRHTLEDADLYFNSVNGVLVEISHNEKKVRRRKAIEKVQNLPGKLDHVSVVAYNVGVFKN